MSGLDAFKLAHAEYLQAAENLIEATKVALPIGTRVSLTMGRAEVVGPVTAAGGSWWHNPGSFSVLNERTGKVRHSTLRYALEAQNLMILADEGGAA